MNISTVFSPNLCSLVIHKAVCCLMFPTNLKKTGCFLWTALSCMGFGQSLPEKPATYLINDRAGPLTELLVLVTIISELVNAKETIYSSLH